MSDLLLLALEIETCLVMVAPGRFARENSPDNAPGPKVMIAGCAQGNIAAVRADVDDAAARAVLDGVAAAPAWTDGGRLPPWVGEIATRVGAAEAEIGGGPAWRLPNALGFDRAARIVAGESEEGAEMLERFAREGMPRSLAAAGYIGPEHLWPPWCAAMADGEIAALCCAARLGARGAEAGLYSFPPFRGRGFGAAVTAAWSALPSLAGRTLFYSTSWSNRSSIAVTRRLGLPRIGATARIS